MWKRVHNARTWTLRGPSIHCLFRRTQHRTEHIKCIHGCQSIAIEYDLGHYVDPFSLDKFSGCFLLDFARNIVGADLSQSSAAVKGNFLVYCVAK